MTRRMIPLELVAALLTVLILASFGFLIVQTVGRINDGQRAVVCILAISPTERTAADVDHCLSVNGLGT